MWAARDWYFRRGHLIDPAGLAAEILHEGTASAESTGMPSHIDDEWAKENLREHLVKLMDKNVLEDVAGARHDFAMRRDYLFKTRHDLAVAVAGVAKVQSEVEAEQRKFDLAHGNVIKEQKDKLDDLNVRLINLKEEIDSLRTGSGACSHSSTCRTRRCAKSWTSFWTTGGSTAASASPPSGCPLHP